MQRRSGFRARVCRASLTVALLASSPARAQSEPIRVEYHADASCPSAAEFVARVLERTTSARLVEDDSSARTFVVQIERSGAGVVGSLVIREADGTSLARTLKGARCVDVARVLALATALAIDPHAALSSPTEPEDAEPTLEPDPPDKPAQPATPVEPVPATPRDVPPPDPSEPARARIGSWAVTFGPVLVIGPAPRAAFGGTIGLEWSPSASISALGVDLGAHQAPSSSVAGASSSFWFAVGRPYACAYELGSGPVRVAPCLGADLGVVNAAGSDLPISAERRRFWAAAVGTARLRIELGEDWFLQGEGDLLVPLTRYRFVFLEPETKVHDVPSTAAAFSARAGTRF